jgi:rhodanese-related sulfurtransferase
MQSLTAIALQQKIDNKDNFQLIDVREPYEHEEFNIGGTLIPLGEITQQYEKIATDKPVIIYCRKGIRSQIAIQRLQEKFPFTNLINLIGGTEAYKKQFGV